METVKPKTYSIQGSFTATFGFDDWVISTRFSAKVYEWNVTILFNSLAPSVLSGLIHTSTTSNRTEFCTHLSVTKQCRWSTVHDGQELIQLVKESHIVFSNLSGSGQVKCSSRVIFSISTSDSNIQTVESIGVYTGITVNNGIVEQCGYSFNFLGRLECYFIGDTTHTSEDTVNFISTTKDFKVNGVALLLNFVSAVFFVDTTELCGRLGYKSSVTIGQSSTATQWGYSVIKSQVIQKKIRFSKFIDNTSLNIILYIQACLCESYWH